MTETILTKISDHGKTSTGSACATGAVIGRTQIGWGMYTLVSGKGSNRKSITMHCSESAAQAEKARVKND